MSENPENAGTFARRHRCVFVGPCHLCVHGPPAETGKLKRSNNRGFTSVQKFHTHTNTNLLRTVIANSDVECILRAKNTPVEPDRID